MPHHQTIAGLFAENPTGMILFLGFIALIILELVSPRTDASGGVIGPKRSGGRIEKGQPLSRQQRVDQLVAQGMRRGTAEKVVARDELEGGSLDRDYPARP